MNNWALITGASSGIGYELAKLLAADRFNLVLVARREIKLRQFAEELRARHGIAVKVLAKDLSSTTAAKEIFEELHDTPISILVNNAGFGWYGAFAKEELKNSLDMMHVNMDALVELTRWFLPQMLARREGRILNVASTAAFQPGPFSAVYYATKAFDFSFSCALTEELSDTGITVTTLCPGGTHTEFHVRAGGKLPVSRLFPIMEAKEAAEAGYRGLMQGRQIVIPGAMNQITSTFAKCMPTRFVAKVVRKINREGDQTRGAHAPH
jgi:short-subunit dehydrogenase